MKKVFIGILCLAAASTGLSSASYALDLPNQPNDSRSLTVPNQLLQPNFGTRNNIGVVGTDLGNQRPNLVSPTIGSGGGSRAPKPTVPVSRPLPVSPKPVVPVSRPLPVSPKKPIVPVSRPLPKENCATAGTCGGKTPVMRPIDVVSPKPTVPVSRPLPVSPKPIVPVSRPLPRENCVTAGTCGGKTPVMRPIDPTVRPANVVNTPQPRVTPHIPNETRGVEHSLTPHIPDETRGVDHVIPNNIDSIDQGGVRNGRYQRPYAEIMEEGTVYRPNGVVDQANRASIAAYYSQRAAQVQVNNQQNHDRSSSFSNRAVPTRNAVVAPSRFSSGTANTARSSYYNRRLQNK